jgi:archaetidylinositol phosphate synthase
MWRGAVLDRLRERLDSTLNRVGKAFSRISSSPTDWSIIGLALSGVAGVAYSATGYRGELAGGLLILVAGAFDIIDGAVARATERESKKGAFLDSNFDRVAEVVIFLGILIGRHATGFWVVLALSLSLLVSYARAKGDSLGVTLSGVGIGERSERLLILAVASIIGLAGWGVVLVAIVAALTYLERTWRAARWLG